MTPDDILKEYTAQIAFVALMRGENLSETAFKFYCVYSLLRTFRPGDVITSDELAIVLEDYEAPISMERRIELAVETRVVQSCDGTGYRVAENIALQQVFPRELRRFSIETPVDAFAAILAPVNQQLMLPGKAIQPTDCLNAVTHSWSWAIAVISYCLRENLRGVPVFWPRDYGYVEPMGRDVGTTSTLDAFLLLFAPTMHGLVNAKHHEALGEPVVLDYLEMLLSMQRRQDGWVNGAFALDGYDDDFVGAFVPPEQCPGCPSGPCPTVEGTAVALLLYALVVRSELLTSPDNDGRRHQERGSLDEAVQQGVQFLLRTQLPNGAWGVYRFENDAFPLRPRELACRNVVEALAEVRRTSLLDREVDGAVAAAVDRYVAWALQTRQESADGVFWTPEFTMKEASEGQRLASTVWVASSLFFALRGWPEQRAAVEPVLRRTIAYLLANWTPNRQAYGSTEVRAATWKGPAVSTLTWEMPLDPMVVSLLVMHYREIEPTMPGEAWSKINEAVANFLADEENGKWIDFLMSREGNYRAMPSNTLHYNRALLDYLHYLRDALNGLFAGKTV